MIVYFFAIKNSAESWFSFFVKIIVGTHDLVSYLFMEHSFYVLSLRRICLMQNCKILKKKYSIPTNT